MRDGLLRVRVRYGGLALHLLEYRSHLSEWHV